MVEVVTGTVTDTLVGDGPQPDGQGLTVVVKPGTDEHFGQRVIVMVSVAVVRPVGQTSV
jgi:hypothetical protein